MTQLLSFESVAATPVVQRARRERGRRGFLAGQAAEQAVARAYEQRGADLLEVRWRGSAGEIDLIFLHDGAYVFVEVKKARSFDSAADMLRPAQMRRIHGAASEYLALTQMGQMSEVRFDLAMCNAKGEVDIRDGAFSHF